MPCSRGVGLGAAAVAAGDGRDLDDLAFAGRREDPPVDPRREKSRGAAAQPRRRALVRELEVRRGDVLLEVGDRCGARDGDDDRRARAQPGERHLGARGARAAAIRPSGPPACAGVAGRDGATRKERRCPGARTRRARVIERGRQGCSGSGPRRLSTKPCAPELLDAHVRQADLADLTLRSERASSPTSPRTERSDRRACSW